MASLPTKSAACVASEDWGRAYYDPIDVSRMGLTLIQARADGTLLTRREFIDSLDMEAAMNAVSLGRDVLELSDGEFIDGVFAAALGEET